MGIRGRLAHEIASPARVRLAMKSFNPFKSPGPDIIYPFLLQRAGDPIIGPLVRLTRASLTLGYVRICSDSRAAIATLSKSVTILRLVWGCYEALNKLEEDNQVTVFWTPGHRGIKGNETADRLAKLATKKTQLV